MNFVFPTLAIIRANTLKAISHLSHEQLTKIPNGYGNNVAWNLGHMVATQQILCYKIGGVKMLLPEEFINNFKKDSSPKIWTKPFDLEEVQNYFELTNSAFQKDYENNLFANYTPYTTSAGVTLSNIEEAILYNYGHENLHYGYILAMRKLV